MTQQNKKKEIARFHPLRILLVCGVQGLSLLFIAVMGCGAYGFFTGAVLPFATIAKVAGIAFAVGCVMGAKNL